MGVTHAIVLHVSATRQKTDSKPALPVMGAILIVLAIFAMKLAIMKPRTAAATKLATTKQETVSVTRDSMTMTAGPVIVLSLPAPQVNKK